MTWGIDMVRFPDKKYKIIYADPPWSYYNDSDSTPNHTTRVGVRKPPYSVLSSETIKKLPVERIAHKESILFLWTTDYHLQKAIEVMNSWGFEYKTVGFAWQKLTKGGLPVCFTGAFTLKSGIELCLIGTTRGFRPRVMIKNKKVKALIQSEREEHSKKPDIVRKRIVELCGNVSRIELFARKKSKGWDVWGDQV